jgi:hypothetical protein
MEKKMKLKIDAYGKEYKYISSAKNKFIPTKNKSNVNREIISLKERLESIGFVRVNLDNSKIHSSTYINVIDASGRFVIAETYLKNRSNTTNNQQLEIYDLWGLESDVKLVIKQINKDPIKSGVYTCR